MLTADFVKGTYLLLSLVDANAETSVTIHSEDVVICLQETVTFTCTVQSGRILQWEAKPFITSTLNQIIFLSNDNMPTRDFISSGVRFEAVLTWSELVQGSSTHYTLQSTLSTTASTTTNGTVIECQEYYTAASDNSTLQLNELAPPSNVQYSVTSYGTSEVTGDIEWNSSMDSSVDNFTIALSSLHGSTDLGTVASSPLEHVTLNYNTNYTISVKASNCAGSSIPGVVLFMEPGCPPPSQPVNGSVSGFTNTRAGSEVTYYCDEGLNLVGERVAVCTLGLVWDPMGSKVMCAPPPPEVTLVPTPSISQIPIPKHPVSQSTQECGTAVAVGITGVVCTVVAFTVGALFGGLFLHLITRARCKPQSQFQTQKPAPMYEDVENITSAAVASAVIELKSNEAYHPLRKQHISSTPNVTYGNVHP